MMAPYMQLMMKEISLRGSLAYTDADFKATVDAFVAGKRPSLTQNKKSLKKIR